MKLKILAIHDSKSEMFGRPFFVRAYGEGERMFIDVVNDGKSDYSKHPGDFTLFEVGEFDDVSGTVIPLPAPRSMGVAVQFKTSDPAQIALLKDGN